MGTVDQLLGWARSQLGTTETPPGSNRVPYWDIVGMPGAQGQPWCAAFVLAGLDVSHTPAVTRSVYVPTIIEDYRRAGRFSAMAHAQPGDQVLYHLGDGHTGVVLSVDTKAKTVTAIEGNTSSGNSGSQTNGGGVYQRTRPWTTCVGVGRPLFDPPTLEDNMVLTDQGTGGVWVAALDGAVYAYDGAPYLGGVNNSTYNPHRWPCVGIATFINMHGEGYTLVLDAAAAGEGDRYRRYRFPRDGSARV